MDKDNATAARNVKKRGIKPKSKRNRKRPRSEVFSNDNLTHETYTCRLELNNKPVGQPCSWIRIVKPYSFTFSTFAKARWIGRSLLDIYHTEFGSYPRSYYENAILEGRILVSDQKVDPTYAVKGPDVLTHTVHRHEPAVAVSFVDGTNVRVVQETDDLVAVDKPGTLPVHPCGGYRVNSLLNILEPKFGKLFTINRLDRLTSGLVILAKASSTAQELGRCIMARDTCQKIYLARVRGKFPQNCPSDLCIMKDSDTHPPCRYGEWTQQGQSTKDVEEQKAGSTSQAMRRKNCLGYWITDKAGALQHDVTLSQLHDSKLDEEEWLRELETRSDCGINGSSQSGDTGKRTKDMLWLHLACPTRIAMPKDGICGAGSFDDLEDAIYKKTVKASETAFGVVRYCPRTDSTIVLCRPMTGRTHQIRLHLQFLGHPIANDPNYGGSLWYGDPKGEEACRSARAELDEMDRATVDAVKQLKGGDGCESKGSTLFAGAKAPSGSTSTDTPATEEEIRIVSLQPRVQSETMEDYIKKTCVWCRRSRGGGNHRTMLEFLVRSRGIWLHALQYAFMNSQGKRGSFRTDLPSWSVVGPISS